MNFVGESRSGSAGRQRLCVLTMDSIVHSTRLRTSNDIGVLSNGPIVELKTDLLQRRRRPRGRARRYPRAWT